MAIFLSKYRAAPNTNATQRRAPPRPPQRSEEAEAGFARYSGGVWGSAPFKKENIMKFIKAHIRKISLTLILLLTVPFAVQGNPSLPYIHQSTQMRGLWVTSAYNLDWPSRQGLTPAQLKAEIDDILNRAAAQGINAVFVQVRPVGDALHRSEIFPWSHLLTGTQGVAPADNFDPLEYWITQAHALGIQVHAWLNPYRVTFPNQNITNVQQLYRTHPARLNPSTVVAYGSSLFFDPGNPAARQIVIDGVEELLRNYNLDGIHMDDYFYPSRNFPDSASFARYGGGMDLHDWRRENVNTLIQELQRVTHNIRPGASFGVSPFAIWRNAQNDPRGSQTGGLESYFSQYADTRRWVLEGWVDYIAPQIYWVEGTRAACYEIVLSWWEDLVAGTDVRLYIGLAPYREVRNWEGWEGQIIRQLERNARSPVVSGSIFFREQFMRSSVGDEIGRFYATNLPGQVPTRRVSPLPPLPPEPPAPPTDSIPVNNNTQPPLPPPDPFPDIPRIPIPTLPMPAPPAVRMDALTVAQPSRASFTVTDAQGFWFFGTAIPGVNVYVNNELITDRTEEGFFSVFMPLVRGNNEFVFTQAGQPSVSRTIANNAPPGARQPATMTVGIQDAFPATEESARYGTTITLSATAPAGATVTAQLAGQTINLTQTNPALQATDSNILAASFTGTFTLNTNAPSYAIVDIGRPVYTMTWNGQTRTATAAGTIRQLGVQAPFFAEVNAPSTWVFPQAGTAGGSGWLLENGQVDRVAAITGDWVRLASGGWVARDSVRLGSRDDIGEEPPLGFLSEGRYVIGAAYDVIRWDAPFFPAVYAAFDGAELIVTIGVQGTAPPIFHAPSGTLFSNIRTGTHNGAPAYFMTLAEGAHLEGFFFEYEDGELRLTLRRRRQLANGLNPFTGFTFVIDAGHGGTDSGAIGPMGAVQSEAVLVLAQADIISRELEALGANVVRVRDTDVFYTLQERVESSRQARPDMFISLHINATAETTNATNIRGFTVWHRNANSHPAAAHFMEHMYNINPGTNRHQAPNQANFFVCRPAWAPHILLEASFINNIHDFSWLINPRRQEEYARAVINTLLAYYR